MLVQFKDLKKGDYIVREGALFKLCAPEVHLFKNKQPVITVKANFVERRKNRLENIFNKRKIINLEIEQGLCLQGFYTEQIEVISKSKKAIAA